MYRSNKHTSCVSHGCSLCRDLRDANDLTKPIQDAYVTWSPQKYFVQTVESHSNRINLVVFSHKSSELASTPKGMTTIVWHASSGKCLLTLSKHPHINLVL